MTESVTLTDWSWEIELTEDEARAIGYYETPLCQTDTSTVWARTSSHGRGAIIIATSTCIPSKAEINALEALGCELIPDTYCSTTAYRVPSSVRHIIDAMRQA